MDIRFIKICMTFVLGILVQFALAQEKEVTGEVTDKDGEPLPGVNVVVQEEEGAGTQTDFNGNFSLQVEQGNTLKFSYVGFEDQVFEVEDDDSIDIIMEEGQNLGEVEISVGYGTQERKNVTGSVVSVETSDLNKKSTSDISRALEGSSPGVSVTSNGEPGAEGDVTIRGVGTFGNHQPLYVVDGVPVGTSIRDFNPNDIESMEILKDASSAAIYGSRAANGVVLIETKRGEKDTPLEISYSGYYGIDKVGKHIPVLGREDYQMISNEKRENAGNPLIAGNDPNSNKFIDDIDTDWQKVGYETGTRQNHNVNFTGGGEDATYNSSLNYYKNEGIFVGSGPDYERYSGRMNMTYEKGIFKISPALYYTHSSENNLFYDSNNRVLTGTRPPLNVDLVTAIPTLGVYDENNEGGYAGTNKDIHNEIVLNVPGANTMFETKTEVDRIFAVVNPELKLLDTNGHALTYKLNAGYDRTNTRNTYFNPEFEMGYFFGSGKSLMDDNSTTFTNELLENTLEYKKKIGKHDFTLLMGETYQKESVSDRQARAEKFPKPYKKVISNGSNADLGGSETSNALFSYFGRLNYNYDNRYLLTATFRRDGSSRFAKNNRYGNFPSMSFGWRINNEDFFNVDKVDDLKLRVSYGKLGNQNIGNYLYQSTVNRNIPYNFSNHKVFGGIQTKIVDSDIKWETTKSLDVGLDATLFDEKVDLSIEYYDKKTSDILVGVPIPGSVGSVDKSPTVNAGEVKNSGVDVALMYHFNTDNDFSFDVSANVSYLNNKVLSLGGDNEPINGVGSRTQVGREIGEHYGHVYDGIFQNKEEIENYATASSLTAPGDIRFRDLNDDGEINGEDRTFLGSGMPKINYGLSFNAEYKNFDFSLLTSGKAGYKINSRFYRMLMGTTGFLNAHKDILDRWTPDNTDTNTPRVVEEDPNDNNRDSDRSGWLQKGDYLRIDNISLGYTLPENNFLENVLSSIRIYANIQNLYTFTGYKGYNPDFNSNDVFSPGYDNGSYPRPRTYMIGLDLTF